MPLSILTQVSTRDPHINPIDFSPMDDIGRGTIPELIKKVTSNDLIITHFVPTLL